MYKPIPRKTVSIVNRNVKLTPTQNKWAKGIANTSMRWLDVKNKKTRR